MHPRLAHRLAPLILCLALGGCAAYRNRNNGQRLQPRAKHHQPSKQTHTLQAQVTTGADGAVTDIEIVRSSGSAAVDGFVAESIRSNWPDAAPLRRTVVEVTHSPAEGFSEPRVISIAPAQ